MDSPRVSVRRHGSTQIWGAQAQECNIGAIITRIGFGVWVGIFYHNYNKEPPHPILIN